MHTSRKIFGYAPDNPGGRRGAKEGEGEMFGGEEGDVRRGMLGGGESGERRGRGWERRVKVCEVGRE